jgi:hypothetical protein
MRRNRVRLIGLVMIGLCALICSTVSAEDNIFRFGGGAYFFIGDFNELGGTGYGVFGEYEKKFSDRVGLGAEVQYQSYSGEEICFFGECESLGDLTQIALTLNPNFYLLHGDKVQVYIGPMIGFGMLDGDGEDQSESAFLWGAGIGVDVPFGDNGWNFVVKGRYMSADYISDEEYDDLDATATFGGQFGFGKRF